MEILITTKKYSTSVTNNPIKASLDRLQKEIHLFLKPMGFRKNGRSFNRQTEAGIYQVLHLQSGPYEVGTHVIPGLRENYYGKFTVNLGVVIQEIYELDGLRTPKEFYREYECQIRTRLPHLTLKRDQWWSLAEAGEETSEEIIEGLKSHGLPWLDTFGNREKICENWGRVEGSSARAKLDVALIILQKDPERGSELMQEYYDQIQITNGHRVYVKDLAQRLAVELKS